MNARQLFTTPLRRLPPIAVVFAAALGFAFWQLIVSTLSNIVYPVVDYAFGVDFRTLYVDLEENPSLNSGPYHDTVAFGPALTSIIAALVAWWLLFKVFRYLWEEASEGDVECPYCLSLVPAAATKCAYCASDLPEIDGDAEFIQSETRGEP